MEHIKETYTYLIKFFPLNLDSYVSRYYMSFKMQPKSGFRISISVQRLSSN